MKIFAMIGTFLLCLGLYIIGLTFIYDAFFVKQPSNIDVLLIGGAGFMFLGLAIIVSVGYFDILLDYRGRY